MTDIVVGYQGKRALRLVASGTMPSVSAGSELPSGTVTFLFTDIEGSTWLLGQLGQERYGQVLVEHARILRDVFAGHDGHVVDTQGDSFFVAFRRARDAVAAALETQRALAAHGWPEGGALKVRMGLHTGTPLLAETGYVGMDVHRAARIAAAAHGGQVVVSQSTRALVGDGLALDDLGEHRFKDLSAPERLFQLGEGEFPPLKSLYRTNLPVPATAFLGREAELAQVVELLGRQGVRLVTLTGPGGTGKTRLALQAAAEASERFPDGVWWVPLAPVRDPTLVLAMIAQAVEVKEEPGKELVATLVERLRGKQALLLLDNTEHLLPAIAGDVAALLAGLPTMTVAVTSRERLQLQGEHVWPVPPLGKDDGVELFSVRARALDPSFAATPVLGDLCERLDNLPLALELAAARTTLFTPEQLLERLGQRLDLKGGRDADARQQTLRATISWSHDLLSEDEQRLFRRLAVFVGGCAREAAETVCEADPETFQALLDKSLLRRRDTELGPRYWMLETIREYAEERLAAADDAALMRRRAVDVALEFAVAAQPGWRNLDTFSWLRRFRLELDNLRQAIRWALDGDMPERALAIAADLDWLWQETGLLREGCEWIEMALFRGRPPDPGLEGNAFLGLGVLYHERGEQEKGEQFLRQSLPLLLEGGRAHDRVYALYYLGGAVAQRDHGEAKALLRQAETEARALGDMSLVALALQGLSFAAFLDGERESARALLEEALLRTSNPGHRVGPLANLAEIALGDGDLGQARTLLAEARSVVDREDVPRQRGPVYVTSAYVELINGSIEEAEMYLTAARAVADHSGAQRLLAAVLLGEAALHARRGRSDHAVETWSRAASVLQALAEDWYESESLLVQTLLEPLRSRLSETDFRRAWSGGQAAPAVVASRD